MSERERKGWSERERVREIETASEREGKKREREGYCAFSPKNLLQRPVVIRHNTRISKYSKE